MGERIAIQLGPMDRLMPSLYTRMLFFFERKLNIEALEKALETIMKRDYKAWRGTVNDTELSSLLLCDTSSPTSLISYQTIDYSFSELCGSERSFRKIPKELIYPRELFASPQNAPALLIQVSFFSKSDGCVLAVSLHHRVGDGSAQFAFMKTWCDEAKGVQHSGIPKIHDRSALPVGEVPLIPPPAYRYMASEDGREPKVGVPTTVVRFSSKGLNAFKAKHAATILPPQYISTNDLLLSVIWRAITRARKLSDETTVSIKFNIDARRRNVSVPETYTGGATFFALIESKVSELLKSTLTDTALLFRKRILEFTPKYVSEVIAFVAQSPNAELAFPDVFLSNWDTFGDLTTYDFGDSNGGYPAAIRLPPVGIEGLGYILPSEDGIDFMIALSPPDLERFKNDAELAEAGAIILGDMQ